VAEEAADKAATEEVDPARCPLNSRVHSAMLAWRLRLWMGFGDKL
jgi:hypothetical protein